MSKRRSSPHSTTPENKQRRDGSQQWLDLVAEAKQTWHLLRTSSWPRP
jgi:hypothetical protein